MIGYLEGKVKTVKEGSIILLIEGGIGYEVFTQSPLLNNLSFDQSISLYIYTHVREDQITLFGFQEEEELVFFKNLLSVSGIGPKVALAIISSASIEELKDSISSGDSSILSSVSGVGKKTAEKAVIELRGKIAPIGFSKNTISAGDADDLYLALAGLGFRKEEILSEIKKMPKEIEASEEKIKWLIKNLGSR